MLNQVVFLLSEYFREALGQSNLDRIAKLLNACCLDDYGGKYFEEDRVRQRIRRARLSGQTTYYEMTNLNTSRETADLRSILVPDLNR